MQGSCDLGLCRAPPETKGRMETSNFQRFPDSPALQTRPQESDDHFRIYFQTPIVHR